MVDSGHALIFVKSYREYSVLHSRCNTDGKTAMEWARWIEDRIGPPENCKGFVLRTRERYMYGMFITNNGWATQFNSAAVYDWDETAVRCSNNHFLEAIRIGPDGVAESSDGEIVGVL